MAQFQYKNPIVNSQVTGADSVENRQTYNATNFSVYNVGGYMEVWNLSDLEYTFGSETGFIELSANTIPVKFNKSPNILADRVYLYNDGISSGRRRLGMLVYVHENNTTYQFQIDENNSADSYENMWSAATAVTNLVSETSEEIAVANKVGVTFYQEGQDLIDAWTGSTIEGYNGATRDNAKWRVFWGTDWQVTGGTINYNSTGDLSLSSNSGNTVTLSGLTTITGGTYLNGTTTLELYNNLGETISITGFTSGGSSSSIVGGNGVEISGDGSITTPYTADTIYNTILTGSLEMEESVGGLPAGTTVSSLTGKSLVEIFNDILFPTALPTYTSPTITLQGLSSQTLEVGTTTSININAKGVKNDAGDYTVLRVRTGTTTPNVDVIVDNSPTTNTETDVPNQFGFNNPNNPNSGFTSTSLTYTLTVPEPSVGNTNSLVVYDAEGDYNAGLAKNDNKGNTDTRTAQVRSSNAPQAASNNFNSSDRSITGVYPYWYGKSTTQPTISTIQDAISGGTANKSSITNSQDGTLTITFNASSEFIWFAHFEEYNTKQSYYVTDLNKGDFGPTGLFQTFVTGTIDSPDSYWSGVTYKIYIGNYQTDTTGFGSMQLRTSTV
jgi:hypothetical protein